ncbi:MAG: penicillin acylase family protein [Actinobacteria bacterium]|nr:penicillin acylase family protein [Actinomycetota bacterium]
MRPVRRLARRSLPQTSGTLNLAGLDRPVEVIRDRFGFAHVYASSRHDLVRAQGFVHAQDRLFQMEMIRRFASGRLSEVAGARTLDLDRLARRLRLRWAAEQDLRACDPETVSLLRAYCAGVNEFIARGRLPLELRLARVRPEPWTLADALAPGQMFAVTLSGNWENEIARMRLAERVGEERARRLDPDYPEDHPVIVPKRLEVQTATRRDRIGSGASNSWVVAGSRTANGKPILANDPHLLLGMPATWHVQHVVWDEGEAAGFTVPGSPVVVLGRNERVAWGLTTAMIDTQDLFVERFDPGDSTRYEADGDWAEAEVVEEEIRVRGRRAPVRESAVVTRHGPVVARVSGTNEALALRWSAHEPGETTRSLLDLMTARCVAEADRALDRFAAPPHNVVLADADGAIAYRLAGGPIPRRAGGDGSVPVPGWDSSHEWDGWIAQDELPRVRDPERGFIVTANNRIAGEDYPHELPGEYLSGYRARRIEELLGELEHVTLEDCRRIQLDLLSVPGLELREIAREFSSPDPLEHQALDVLEEWDGELGSESAGGAVYAALLGALEREAYGEAAEDPLVRVEPESLPGGYCDRNRPALLRMLAARDDTFFADGRTWEGVFRQALTHAVRVLGPNRGAWRHGRDHRLRFAHAFDGIRGLSGVLSRGPYAVGGDADTVQIMASAAGPNGSVIGPSMRAVFDLGDPSGNAVMLSTGQSGHVASPHYDDLIPPWLAGELVPLALDRADVESLAEGRLFLDPASPAE